MVANVFAIIVIITIVIIIIIIIIVFITGGGRGRWALSTRESPPQTYESVATLRLLMTG